MTIQLDTQKNYHKLVWISAGVIIVFKCVLMGLFSSDYQDKMFIPFVRTFLTGKSNPYEYYYQNRLLSSFPYSPLMLMIESIGGLLIEWLRPVSIFWRNFLFKVPLLLFDILGFVYIRRIDRHRAKYALLLYFCSPVLLYATYMHGQLDIIPTSLLIAAIYYLTHGNEKWHLLLYAVLLGMALGTKLHILAALPALFLYIFKKHGFKTMCWTGAVSLCTLLAIVAPFWSEGFLKTVILNREQSIITQVYLDYRTIKLLLPVLMIGLIYLKIFQLGHMNRQLLTGTLGVLFAVFLVCIPPMPAWFLWVIPFITLYFQSVHESKYTMLAIYLLFNGCYLFFFIFCHETAFVDLLFLGTSLQGLKLGSSTVSNVSFTMMAACLLALLVEMYQFGVASSSLYKRRGLPFTIGIAGDSGTGKSELLQKLEGLLGGSHSILYIEGDGDHRWERGSSEWEKYTHLDPKANYLYRQAEDIVQLRSGGVIQRVEYDHNTGKFTELRKIHSKQYIILCGLHSLYLPQTRSVLDLKIFMDTDEALRRHWKIQRDTGKRGYSDEEIIQQIEKRMPDAERYIYPQRQFADLSIHYFDDTLCDIYDKTHSVVISLKLTFGIGFDAEPMIRSLSDVGIAVRHSYCEDMRHQEMILTGEDLEKKDIPLSKIAHEIIPEMDELFPHKIEWGSGVDGILQMVILAMICARLRGEL